MQIKSGDTVKVIRGKDRGKSGKVVQAFPRQGLLSIEGVNLSVKHLRARKAGERGQKVQFPAPMPACKVLVVCPQCGKPTRIGVVRAESGVRERKCKHCQATFR
ncbi:MAG: 50S ribosomal protein L24 [Patescibacteria group bacterium]|nr:50S ribosomal protein L24 [Patescibacteria group bacterium]